MTMKAPATLRFVALATILVLAAASISGCGSSGSGLIPAGNAGPLQRDFQRVAEVAMEGNGDCVPTEEAIEATERDFRRLPSSVDAGLRERLSEGIANLRRRAMEACKQPSGTATTSMTTTTTTPKTTTTTTSESSTETETTSSSSSEPEPPITGTTPTESGEGGGTEAPSGEPSPEETGVEEAGGSVP